MNKTKKYILSILIGLFFVLTVPIFFSSATERTEAKSVNQQELCVLSKDGDSFFHTVVEDEVKKTEAVLYQFAPQF